MHNNNKKLAPTLLMTTLPCAPSDLQEGNPATETNRKNGRGHMHNNKKLAESPLLILAPGCQAAYDGRLWLPFTVMPRTSAVTTVTDDDCVWLPFTVMPRTSDVICVEVRWSPFAHIVLHG